MEKWKIGETQIPLKYARVSLKVSVSTTKVCKVSLKCLRLFVSTTWEQGFKAYIRLSKKLKRDEDKKIYNGPAKGLTQSKMQ